MKRTRDSNTQLPLPMKKLRKETDDSVDDDLQQGINLLDLPQDIILMIFRLLIVPEFDFPFPRASKDKYIIQLYNISLYESIDSVESFTLTSVYTFKLFRGDNPQRYGYILEENISRTHQLEQLYNSEVRKAPLSDFPIADTTKLSDFRSIDPLCDTLMKTRDLNDFIKVIKSQHPDHCRCIQKDELNRCYAFRNLCGNVWVEREKGYCKRDKLLIGAINWEQIAEKEVEHEAFFENNCHIYGTNNNGWFNYLKTRYGSDKSEYLALLECRSKQTGTWQATTFPDWFPIRRRKYTKECLDF
jgi:hypothetical protein